MVLKTAIYVRQSADRADSVSLETQEALCRRELVPGEAAEVYADRGYSGKNTKRPGLAAMMEGIRRGEIGRVLVYKLDRISRNLADFTDLLRVFGTYGVQFHSHTERFETATPMGQAMQSLLMVFAQLERETICGRVRDAAFTRAKLGFDTGGPPPIGFAKAPFQLMGRHTQYLVPDENAGRIMALFRSYGEENRSLSEIAACWNAQGFVTARGSAWSRAALCRILRNPVYACADSAVYTHLAELGATLCLPEPLLTEHGVYLYRDRRLQSKKLTDLHGTYAITAPHKGLVEGALWLQCQQRMTGRRGIRTLGCGERTWLSGSIFCKRCGSAMTAVQGRSDLYLVCGGRKRGICGGAGATWRTGEAELLIGAVLAEESAAAAQGEAVSSAKDTAALQELERLRLRRARLMQALTESDDTAVSVLTEAIAAVDGRITALGQPAPVRMHSVAVPPWESLDAAQKKTIAQRFLCCAMVDGDTIELYLR